MLFVEQIYSVKFTQYNKYYYKAEYLYLMYYVATTFSFRDQLSMVIKEGEPSNLTIRLLGSPV